MSRVAQLTRSTIALLVLLAASALAWGSLQSGNEEDDSLAIALRTLGSTAHEAHRLAELDGQRRLEGAFLRGQAAMLGDAAATQVAVLRDAKDRSPELQRAVDAGDELAELLERTAKTREGAAHVPSLASLRPQIARIGDDFARAETAQRAAVELRAQRRANSPPSKEPSR